MLESFLPLSEALEYVSKYKIKSLEGWKNFVDREDTPDDLPEDPEIYGLPHKEFFGCISRKSIQEAKKWARANNIQSLAEWKEKAKKDPSFPSGLPVSLTSYINKGWTTAKDFFNTKPKRRRGSNFLPFKEARDWARASSIATALEWSESKDTPNNIPKSPNTKYSSEWVSWPDFLGVGSERSMNLVPYSEAEKFAQDCSARTVDDWRKLVKPKGVAKQPQISYKDKGWVNWETFLGTSLLNFEDFRSLAEENEIFNLTQWEKFRKNRPDRKILPRIPTKIYEKTLEECFGNRWVTIEEAREFAHQNNLSSMTEWYKACQDGEIPFNIPKNLHRSYKNRGWRGAYDFFGTSEEAKKGRKKGRYLADYDTVREWCSKNEVTTKEDWYKMVSNGSVPNNFTKNPATYFKSYGSWVSWPHFLSRK